MREVPRIPQRSDGRDLEAIEWREVGLRSLEEFGMEIQFYAEA
jgi:hypothetical protein